VPNQNAEVEFNHNQDVQTDMQELRNSLLDVQSVRRGNIISEHRPIRIQLGTNYPSRLIALNPPRPSGRLNTVEPESDVEIRNANIENGDEFQEGANPNVVLNSHPTKFLSYQPNYNEYQNAPNTNFEHSLLYNDFNDPRLTAADQTVISANSNQITLLLYEGDFSRSSSQALTLAPRTVDGPTDPVEIKPDGEVIKLALPTNAPDRWEASLENIDHASLNDEESSDNEVIIDLDIDEIDADSYQLRMARVSFDGQGTDQPEVFTPIQLADPLDKNGENKMADRTELTSSDSFGGPPSELRFTLENTGDDRSVITDIRFDSTNTDATFIDNQEGGDTFRTENGDTLFADRIDRNNQESINELSINGGSQVTVELGQFRDGDGNSGRINMNGDQATITFTFDDGSQDTYVITG
jgi:hypothetical protein